MPPPRWPWGGGGNYSDALSVTAGDEYGSCHGSPPWCGIHSWVGVSRDGGLTFQDTAWDDVYGRAGAASPYRVLVHPDSGAAAIVAAREGLPLTYTADYGRTWGNSSGGEGVRSVGQAGNFWYAQPLARENNAPPPHSPTAPFTAYFYNGTTTLFTSRDSGASFEPTYTGFPPWEVPYFAVATPPRGAAAAPGDVWVFAGWKLYHSVNGGANFSQVWQFYSVQKALSVGPLPEGAAGLARACSSDSSSGSAASSAYAVYVVGIPQYGVQEGLFASVDQGRSWIPLAGPHSTTPHQGLGDTPLVLEPRAKDPGVLFVGTEGRGGYYRNVSGDLLRALHSCAQAQH
jgi:hypothetical protein